MTTAALFTFLITYSSGNSAQLRVITIDTLRRTPISPYIYGVNYPDSWISEWLTEWDKFNLGYRMAREGGNRFTAYNWETNASNAGNDYHFENDAYLGESNEPGWTVRQFLKHVQPVGAASLLTVPTLGFVASDKDANRDGGQDVNHSKDYIHTRFKPSVARKPGGVFTLSPDGKGSVVYEDEFVNWVQHVKSNQAPVWFSLDNEPDLWHSTHLRIKPTAPTYKEIIDNNIEYASAIKSVAPNALVFGAVNYGWYGFRAFQGASDANGRVFVDAYLDALKGAADRARRRLVDVYDFHWYPEAMGEGVRIVYNAAPDKPGTKVARMQAPRSLWDPTYVEDSWITKSNGKKPIALLPDMLGRIARHYPGTKLSISEYDFGGRLSISGAIAQADALGVFGRYGLFAACHWGLTHKDIGASAGFQAFTNFDRSGSRFGDLGLAVDGENPSENSVYAALDSNNHHRMTIVVINKSQTSQRMNLVTKGFVGKRFRGLVVSDGVFGRPNTADARLVKTGVQVEALPESITTLEILNR